MLELSASPHPAAALPPHAWPGIAVPHRRPRRIQVDDDEVEDASAIPMDWTEDDCVQLHWVLLAEINRLADPDTPLDVVFDTLRWIFTERWKDALPFSFVNCLRVVGCSPLSPIAFCGQLDAQAIRDYIRNRMSFWWKSLLARYPVWVRDAVLSHPEWIESQLRQNPQWINEQLKAATAQADFFL
jgi:hypothetical protein